MLRSLSVRVLIALVVGLALGALVDWQLVVTLFGLWVMGCVYNLPPVRTKDHAYVDVASEAINNPIRMLVGWYIVTSTVVPLGTDRPASRARWSSRPPCNGSSVAYATVRRRRSPKP